MSENTSIDALQQLPADEPETGLCGVTCQVSACGHTGVVDEAS